MGATYLHAVASLDGYIADEQDDVGPLHEWYFAGDQPIRAKDAADAVKLLVFPTAQEQASAVWLGGGKNGGALRALTNSAEFLKNQRQIDKVLNADNKPERYFATMNEILKATKKGVDPAKMKFPIPYIVAQKISREADFQNSFQYIRRLLEERKRINSIGGG